MHDEDPYLWIFDMGTLTELWRDYSALWAWADSHGGATPVVLALIITVFLAGLLAATGYLIWRMSTSGADAILRFWEKPGRHAR